MSKLIERLEVPLIPLEYQKPTKINSSYIELYDDRLVYHTDFIADEVEEEKIDGLPESSWVWEEVKNLFHTTYKREVVAGTQISRLAFCYKLTIYLLDGRSLAVYSKRLGEISLIEAKLIDYITHKLDNAKENIPLAYHPV